MVHGNGLLIITEQENHAMINGYLESVIIIAEVKIRRIQQKRTSYSNNDVATFNTFNITFNIF